MRDTFDYFPTANALPVIVESIRVNKVCWSITFTRPLQDGEIKRLREIGNTFRQKNSPFACSFDFIDSNPPPTPNKKISKHWSVKARPTILRMEIVRSTRAVVSLETIVSKVLTTIKQRTDGYEQPPL